MSNHDPENGSGGISSPGNGISRNPDLDFERIIMGIDPGTNVMGYGVLGVNGKQLSVVVMGVIQLSKFESHYKRLARIFERVTSLVEQYLPDELAIEAPFFGKNVQSMLKLGRSQGWRWRRPCRATSRSRNIPALDKAGRHGQRPGLEGAGGQHASLHSEDSAGEDAQSSRRH